MYNGAEIGYCPQMIFWIMFIGNATALRFNSIKSHWCIVQHASLLLSANNGNKSSTTQIVLLCWPLSAQLRAFQRILQLVSTLLGFCSFFFLFLIATTFGQQQHLNHKFFQSINKFDDDWTFVHRSSFCVSFLSISMDLLLFWLRCYCLSWWMCIHALIDFGRWTCHIFSFLSNNSFDYYFLVPSFRFFQKSPSSHRFTSAIGFRSQWINMRSSKIFWFIIEIWIVLFVIFISIFIRMTAMIPFPSLCFLFGAFFLLPLGDLVQ